MQRIGGRFFFARFRSLCDPKITCFEPETIGNLVEGLDFHKFYFDTGMSSERSASHIRDFIRNPSLLSLFIIRIDLIPGIFLQEDLLVLIQVTASVVYVLVFCIPIDSLFPTNLFDFLVLSAKTSKPTINCTMLTPVIHALGDEAACIAYVLLLQYIDRYEEERSCCCWMELFF